MPLRSWPPACWVVTDGKAGMESQCVGLAEALGLQPVIKRVRLRRLWRQTSPYLLFGKRAAISRKGDALQPPWPDLVIATGRLSVLPALLIKERSGGKSFIVQIQNPKLPTGLFDLVIVPAHDRLQGDNVLSVQGALHRVAPPLLQAEAIRWQATYADLPRPLIAVLLGGSNGHYRFGPQEVMQLAPQLVNLARETGGALLITPSRRTPATHRVMLAALLHDVPHRIWNGEGDNPYYGMLGLADGFVVTGDSINMISEACRTGKPVAVFHLPGHADKFEDFYRGLQEAGQIGFFAGALPPAPPTPLDEMTRVAALVKGGFLGA